MPLNRVKGRKAKPLRRASADTERGPLTQNRRWFADQLLAWYGAVQRDLPWRRTRDPYAIWVSEIMLQQTQVATVQGYYTRWMLRFPTIQALADAQEDDVLHAWQGLGYYSRARNLHRAAQQIVQEHAGALPANVEALQALPGIGRYSAGAIASSAFEIAAPIVDGNVTRLLSRFFGLYGDPTRAPLKARLWEVAEQVIPQGQVRDFNQALMEMGAVCCTPKLPLCDQCPLQTQCYAREHGSVRALPESPKRAKVTQERYVALLALHKGRYLIERRSSDAPRWAGLWQFPNCRLGHDETAVGAVRGLAKAAQLRIDKPRLLTSLTHSVTRYRIELCAYHCAAQPEPRPGASAALRWVKPNELTRHALPAPHARIAESLNQERPQSKRPLRATP